ncbi:MAG: glycosyltransferase family 4 protein, partial [Candidatus Nanohaloarchaea archaeon]
MNVLVVSNAPFQPSGYGVVTRNMVPWMQNNSPHDFDVFAMSGVVSCQPIHWRDDIRVYGKTDSGQDHGWDDINRLYSMKDYDLILSFMDGWIYGGPMQGADVPPWIPYMPIDHTPLPLKWRKVLENSVKAVPYTDFGREQVEEAGHGDKAVDPIYHGVDLDTYQPNPDITSEAVEFSEDTFTVGIVKANKGTVQDNELEPGDVGLYIHAFPNSNGGYQLSNYTAELGLSSYVKWPNLPKFRHGEYTDQHMAQIYNAVDVLLNTVAGEGFGLPMLEAMACKTPVIGTDFSSIPELIGEDEERGWLVDVQGWQVTPNKNAQRANPSVHGIKEALDKAYHNDEEREEKGEHAYQWAQQHPWS